MKQAYKFLLEIELDGDDGWEGQAPDPEFLRREAEAAVERYLESADDSELESSNWLGVKVTDISNRADYILSNAPKVHCPKCVVWRVGEENKPSPLSMLATAEVTGPAFYICFSCGHVAQIGVGPVRKEGDEG